MKIDIDNQAYKGENDSKMAVDYMHNKIVDELIDRADRFFLGLVVVSSENNLPEETVQRNRAIREIRELFKKDFESFK